MVLPSSLSPKLCVWDDACCGSLTGNLNDTTWRVDGVEGGGQHELEAEPAQSRNRAGLQGPPRSRPATRTHVPRSPKGAH